MTCVMTFNLSLSHPTVFYISLASPSPSLSPPLVPPSPFSSFIAWKVIGSYICWTQKNCLFSSVALHLCLFSMTRTLYFLKNTQRSHVKKSEAEFILCQNILTKWWPYSDICKYGKFIKVQNFKYYISVFPKSK